MCVLEAVRLRDSRSVEEAQPSHHESRDTSFTFNAILCAGAAQKHEHMKW